MARDTRGWRRAVWWGLGVLVLLAATLAAFNVTVLPHELARRAARLMSDATGWTVEVGSARFAGPTRLLIEDVKVSAANGAAGSAPRAYVTFDPLSLLGLGGSEFDWGRVDLIAPHFILPEGAVHALRSQAGGAPESERREQAPASLPGSERTRHAIEVNVIRGTVEERRSHGPPGLWRAEGTFHVRLDDGPRIRARRLELEHRTDNVTISARGKGADLGELEWTAAGPADLALSLAGESPWRVTGAMSASGTLDVGRGSGYLTVEIAEGDLVWSGIDPDGAIAFDSLRLEIEHAAGEYAVKRIEVTRDEAILTGEGVVRPAPKGAAGAAPELELTVAARGIALPEDIPQVRSLGLSGRAEFAGVVAGTLTDPEISGRLRIKDGTVWRRPVDRGEGVILLRRGLFRFGKTELVRGDAKYELHGEWTSEPARTRIEVTAADGDIKEMLLAAGIDLDVAGFVDGSLTITLGDGGPEVKGEGEATAVRAFGEPLDAAVGRFTWSPGYSRLEDVRVRLGDGSGSVSGEIANGTVNVAVEVDRWPAPERLAGRASGWLSFFGRLTGSTVDPTLQGTVRDGFVAAGKWTIANPAGGVVVTKDLVQLTRLRGTGAGEGLYELNGDIAGWMTDPVFDLDISVERASLSGILEQGGFRLPAMLLDGEVSGAISLEGSVADPKADFDLALADAVGFGEPMRVRFQIDDGRVRLGRSLDFTRS